MQRQGSPNCTPYRNLTPTPGHATAMQPPRQPTACNHNPRPQGSTEVASSIRIQNQNPNSNKLYREIHQVIKYKFKYIHTLNSAN